MEIQWKSNAAKHWDNTGHLYYEWCNLELSICWYAGLKVFSKIIEQAVRIKAIGICWHSLPCSFPRCFSGNNSTDEKMQSLGKNKPDQQWIMFFSSRIFSIVTNVKQSRDTDGHGRDYIIRKMQVRKLYAQFKANCELKKAHRTSWADESFIKKWHCTRMCLLCSSMCLVMTINALCLQLYEINTCICHIIPADQSFCYKM